MKALVVGVALALGLVGIGKAQPSDNEVAVDGGKAPLHGSLMRPSGGVRPVGVLLIAGSGPTDRNGDSSVASVHPANLRLLAEALAKDGVVSLRYDKRGIGASAPAMVGERDLRFGMNIEDAVRWTARLKAEPGVKCVVLLGHSEGALIAAMTAQKTPVCGVISVSGAGRPADQVLVEQLSAQLTPDQMAQLKAILAKLKAGEAVPNAPFPALFRDSIQPYMMSWLSIDPAAELGKVTAPVLILQGTTDIQVGVPDAKRLAAGQPKARLVLLEGVNHVLKAAPADRATDLATYADPTLPLAPGVAGAVIGFVNGIEPRQ